MTEVFLHFCPPFSNKLLFELSLQNSNKKVRFYGFIVLELPHAIIALTLIYWFLIITSKNEATFKWLWKYFDKLCSNIPIISQGLYSALLFLFIITHISLQLGKCQLKRGTEQIWLFFKLSKNDANCKERWKDIWGDSWILLFSEGIIAFILSFDDSEHLKGRQKPAQANKNLSCSFRWLIGQKCWRVYSYDLTLRLVFSKNITGAYFVSSLGFFHLSW